MHIPLSFRETESAWKLVWTLGSADFMMPSCLLWAFTNV